MNEPEHQQHELGPEPTRADVAAGHELSDVSIGGLVMFLAGLVVSLAVVVIAVAGMFVWLMRQAEEADPPQPPLAELRVKQPPAPRLQQSPAHEMEQLAGEQTAVLEQTNWVDQQRKIVRIPIERAMETVATRGLPDWPRVEPETTSTSANDAQKKKPGGDAAAAKESGDEKSQQQPSTEKSADETP
jgi:hypothetical protein